MRKPAKVQILAIAATAIAMWGCRPREFNGDAKQSDSTTGAQSNIAKAIAKCYTATPLQVPRNLSPMVGTDRVCIKHTPNSRSGDFSFEFYSASKLISTAGGSLSDTQPRCMGCFDFAGLEGTVEFRGEQPQETTLTYKDSRDSAVYSWNVKAEEQETPSNDREAGIAKQIAKCYPVSALQVPRNLSPMVGTDKVCIKHTPNSRSGNFSFEFYSAEKLTATRGGNLSETQPRCMGCFDFSGLEGKIEYRAERPEDSSLTLRDSRESAIYSWKLLSH